MKFLGILAAASLALSPLTAVAQDVNDNQVIGVPPQPTVPDVAPIPDGAAAGAVGVLVLLGAGLGIGLGSGGGDGPTGTTSTTGTTAVIN